ncbi:hypothetical protein SAICODRAFT_36050 [Saitoella complicata NRRL Y-17804]|uniref:uncharacterized protein n=1 Tax=Saitoella complicata (strain BCRC 22490 / CBS 7301 / JCM 7358 / NBRC 10748 / NRRL Y-17804) TaxID=698492 RepID=UPI000867555E|nr:uncharacterized protein SAICODRAFT_36050 [Saitoella complicata NRRL Y-17804]ODQ51962.1 hypothetical protein SAICODRAFT_36050 [Saitoella complicata NRRL Y-17804]
MAENVCDSGRSTPAHHTDMFHEPHRQLGDRYLRLEKDDGYGSQSPFSDVDCHKPDCVHDKEDVALLSRQSVVSSRMLEQPEKRNILTSPVESSVYSPVSTTGFDYGKESVETAGSTVVYGNDELAELGIDSAVTNACGISCAFWDIGTGRGLGGVNVVLEHHLIGNFEKEEPEGWEEVARSMSAAGKGIAFDWRKPEGTMFNLQQWFKDAKIDTGERFRLCIDLGRCYQHPVIKGVTAEMKLPNSRMDQNLRFMVGPCSVTLLGGHTFGVEQRSVTPFPLGKNEKEANCHVSAEVVDMCAGSGAGGYHVSLSYMGDGQGTEGNEVVAYASAITEATTGKVAHWDMRGPAEEAFNQPGTYRLGIHPDFDRFGVSSFWEHVSADMAVHDPSIKRNAVFTMGPSMCGVFVQSQ